jgi:hypothetical protein
MGALSGLLELYLYANQLSGNIPPELDGMTSLRRLYLLDNQLSGLVPAELGSLGALQRLRIDSNKLFGPLPVELMDLTSLLDAESSFCANHLSTNDPALSDFLDTKQIGGDWQACQDGAIPLVPDIGLLATFVLLAAAALWALKRAARGQSALT